jgi:exopolyphosphatase/pppGpp-phosphohydrolase
VKVTLVATAVTRTANKIKDIFIKKSKNFLYSSILTQEREGK